MSVHLEEQKQFIDEASNFRYLNTRNRSMAIEIKAPTYPESVQEGTIGTWHKQAGDTVARDELDG
jgi:hypothetical protein